MEYTVHKLAALAGVSGRTLRHYDQIGLLRPRRTTEAGYRLYGPAEVDRLQQILCYRALGLPLADIRDLLDRPGFDELEALRAHRDALLGRRRELDRMIATVDRSIAAREGNTTMTDSEKFEGFKQTLIAQNETQYGAEIRARYGDEAVDASNDKLRNLSPAQYARARELEQQVLDALDAAFLSGDPAGPEARALAALHRDWLCLHWADYSPPAHAGLARMYVDDGRFAAYYDRGTPGKAAFLRDAILHLTGA